MTEVSASDILYTVLAVFAVVGVFFAIGWLFSDDGIPLILNDESDDDDETDDDESDPVDHPDHYNNHPSGIECIDIVEHMGFNLGNAMKYIWRADLKGNDLQDLQKAKWYVDREISKREGR